ncbi:MAG: phosphatase PAP2 family protein [Deltaproteobacteria bacterium]|nr:MAG: phosphatase PAP2 family protein [Deltaproteobacteria bacterium]
MRLLSTLLSVALLASPAYAEEPPQAPPVPPAEVTGGGALEDLPLGLFENLDGNFLDSFQDINLLWHGLAIGGTALMVTTGADAKIQQYFWDGGSILGDTVSDVALGAGNLTPILIPGFIALAGWAADDDEAISAGVAAIQAVGINFVVTTLQKLVTDRPLPYVNGTGAGNYGAISIERTDNPRDFGFSFGGGLAWPSGHTSSHMALASSLVAFYPDEEWLPWVAYPIVALVGLAMIEGDHHWGSDVWAGAFIGHAIGWTVGSNMRERYDIASGKRPAPAATLLDRVDIQPIVSQDTLMVLLSFDLDGNW